MKIVQLIPGSANAFYCENCLRDSSLFKVLHNKGHNIIRLPLYLPIMSEDQDCKDAEKAIFFGGINVYLQQKSALFRKTPRWLDRLLDSPRLLKWAAGLGGMTKAEDLGETTISMLRGEEGNQVKELDRLIAWLAKDGRPDVVHFSNALLLGMARRIKQEFQTSIVCSLQDEDIWVDALPEKQRRMVWEVLAERAAEVDAFISVSKYYKDFMIDRLQVPSDRIHVIYNAMDMEDYEHSDLAIDPPVIGFMERQCREKGLAVLADAFIILKKNGRVPGLKLRIAGGKIPEDEPLLKEVRRKLNQNGISDDVEFLPNLGHEKKLDFLQGISIMSVPAEHKEAFGIYIIEALASGVPVVQPNQGAFPELLEATGGGVLYEPNDPDALAKALESLLLDPKRGRELGARGREIVLRDFDVENMAQKVLEVYESMGQ